MKMSNNTRLTVIQLVLWIALAAVFLCTAFMDGRWQVDVFLALLTTLICLYSYRKNPTPKHLKGLSIACGVSYVALILIYFFGRVH